MDTASQVLWKSDFSFECYKLNCKPPTIDYPVSTHPLNQIHIYITRSLWALRATLRASQFHFPPPFLDDDLSQDSKPLPGITTVLITAVVLMCPTKIPSGS